MMPNIYPNFVLSIWFVISSLELIESAMRRIRREIFVNCGKFISPAVSLFVVSQSSGKDWVNYEKIREFKYI